MCFGWVVRKRKSEERVDFLIILVEFVKSLMLLVFLFIGV